MFLNFIIINIYQVYYLTDIKQIKLNAIDEKYTTWFKHIS